MTAHKKWVTICVAAGLIAACTLAAPPGAGAAFTETKLSADFDWKYEMQTEGPYPMVVAPTKNHRPSQKPHGNGHLI